MGRWWSLEMIPGAFTFSELRFSRSSTGGMRVAGFQAFT